MKKLKLSTKMRKMKKKRNRGGGSKICSHKSCQSDAIKGIAAEDFTKKK